MGLMAMEDGAMGRFFKFGCLSVIGLIVVIIVVSVAVKGSNPSQTGGGQAPSAAVPTELPTVGETASKGGWEVTLDAYGPYEQFSSRPPSTPAQGKRVVIEFTAKNLQKSTSNFTTND